MDLPKIKREELEEIENIKKIMKENFFNRRVINKVFYKMVEKFGLEKAWELIIYLQEYVIYKIYIKEENSSIEKNHELKADFIWIITELINKNIEEFKGEDLLRKTEEFKLRKLLNSLKIIQNYLFEEYKKIIREDLGEFVKKTILKSDKR